VLAELGFFTLNLAFFRAIVWVSRCVSGRTDAAVFDGVKPKFHLVRHVSTRLNTLLACTSFSRFYALTYTNPVCSVK